MPCILNQFTFSEWLYGILLTVAFISGLTIFYRNLSHSDLPGEIFIDVALITTISAIIGARTLYILLYPEQFNSLYEYIAVHEGGLVFYGGFLLAVICLILYCRLKKLSVSRLADIVAPSLALGHAIGRIGCFFNNCCYGKPTDSCHIYQLPSDPASLFRHPTQLYSSAFLFTLFIFLQKSQSYFPKSKIFKPGFISLVYILSYTFFRFLIEFLRGDNRGGFFTTLNLSVSQLISLVIFTIGLVILGLKIKNRTSK
ncbi:MAG: prolipoprotein diacylglyceryl transferase [Candidatus Rifleibacteriota bacterium]